jgi:outer membrane protein OmpA-like peptidoglycan-associated protein
MFKFFIFLFLFQINSFAQEKLEIYFGINKSSIDAIAKLKLDSLIIKNPTLEIIKIESFCDSVDTNSYNKKLSIQRSVAVNKYFIAKKIKLISNLEFKDYGEDFKQSKNQSKNRKAVIYFKNNELKNEIEKAKIGEFIKLKNINFENNSNVVLPKSTRILFDLLKILEEKKNLKIEIQGHICCKDFRAIDTISEARAKAVYDFLIKNKINKNRLKYKGMGVSKPAYKIPELNDYEREQNRRVEILIIEK